MAAEAQAWPNYICISVPMLTLLQTCYINSGADERRELVEEEEDHTYELLLTAQTKIPASTLEPHTSKSTCVYPGHFVSTPFTPPRKIWLLNAS